MQRKNFRTNPTLSPLTYFADNGFPSIRGVGVGEEGDQACSGNQPGLPQNQPPPTQCQTDEGCQDASAEEVLLMLMIVRDANAHNVNAKLK